MKRMKSAWGIFITSAMTYFIFPLSIESLRNMACVAGGICGRYCSFKKVPWAEQFSQLHIAQCKGLPIAESGTLLPARKLSGALWRWRLGKILLVESEILGFGLSPSQRFKGAMARESAAENCLVSGAEESFSFRGGTHFAQRKSNKTSLNLCGEEGIV